MEINNKEELEKGLESIGFVFNPKIVYIGSCFFFLGKNSNFVDYEFDKDIFVLNSKKKNGENLYKNFAEKYFYAPILNNSKISKRYFLPILFSDMTEDGKNRVVRYNYLLTLLNLLLLTGKGEVNLETFPTNEKEAVLCLYDNIKKKRDMFLKTIRYGKDYEYYESISNLYKENNIYLSDENLQKEADKYTEMLYIVKNIKYVLDKHIKFDVEKFKECFDIHELYLMLCKIFVEDALNTEESDKKLSNCFIDALQYVNSVKSYGLKNYNPSIYYYDYNTKKIKTYTFVDLKKEVYEIISRHPEFKTIEINSEEAEKQSITNDFNAAQAYVKKMLDREVLLANWEFVRKGNIDKEKEQKEIENNINKRKGFKTYDKDFYEVFLEKKLLFESTNYMYRIVGKNKFEGYIGYIYPNGIVAFERLYQDKEQTIPVKGNHAVYIMTLDNFTDLSKLSKVEIIKYIKSTNNPKVWRLYHNDTMKNRLMKFINGIYYSDEVEEEIDKLLDDKVISKRLTN